MRSIVLAAFFAIALLASPPVSACTPGSSDPEVDTCNVAHTGVAVPAAVGGPCRYVDNDVCQPNCVAVIHIYHEDNGQTGLQRNDDERDDTCGGLRESDARDL